jgi:hypothetical protein
MLQPVSITVNAVAAGSRSVNAAPDILSQAAMAFVSDAVSFLLLAARPRAAPVVSVFDALAIALCAIGTPSIFMSDNQNDWDAVAWKVAVAVM